MHTSTAHPCCLWSQREYFPARSTRSSGDNSKIGSTWHIKLTGSGRIFSLFAGLGQIPELSSRPGKTHNPVLANPRFTGVVVDLASAMINQLFTRAISGCSGRAFALGSLHYFRIQVDRLQIHGHSLLAFALRFCPRQGHRRAHDSERVLSALLARGAPSAQLALRGVMPLRGIWPQHRQSHVRPAQLVACFYGL